jgi:hypothetical protein
MKFFSRKTRALLIFWRDVLVLAAILGLLAFSAYLVLSSYAQPTFISR